MLDWLIKPVKYLFDEATLILTIKDKKAQRVALALLIAVCILLVPAFMWGWGQYQNYKIHQHHPDSPTVGNQLAPALPEKK